MSKLRIALCGPNVELNMGLAEHIRQLLSDSTSVITLVPPAIQEVGEYSRRSEWNADEIDWLNLLVCSQRRMQEERFREEDILISPTCSIDQVVVQAAWVAEQVEYYSNRLILLQANGQQSIPEESQALVNRSGSILQVLLNLTEEEVVDYYDFVYAVLPASSQLSMLPSEVLIQYDDFLSSVPAFADIVRLPDNETSAIDVLETELEKWKSVLTSS